MVGMGVRIFGHLPLDFEFVYIINILILKALLMLNSHLLSLFTNSYKHALFSQMCDLLLKHTVFSQMCDLLLRHIESSV